LDIAKALLSARGVQEIIELVLETARKLIGAEVALLAQIEPDTGLIRITHALGTDAEFVQTQTLQPGEGVTGRAVSEGKPIWTRDVLADPQITLRDCRREEVRKRGIRAVLAAPLTLQGLIKGALIVQSRTIRPFQEDEVETLVGLASLAAVAIEKARLDAATERTAQRLSTLNDLTRTLSSALDPQAVAREILSAVQSLIPGTVGRVWIQPEADAPWQLVASAGLRDPGGGACPRLENGEGLVPMAVAARHPVTSRDVTQDPRFVNKDWATEEGLVSCAILPLFYGDRLSGTLCVFTRRPHDFSDEEISLLRSFSAHAAIAIENARLYETADRKAREARSLYEVAHRLTTSLDPSEVLHLISVKATELLGTPHAQVVLWDEATGTLRFGAAYGTEADKVRKQRFRLGEGVNGTIAQSRAPLIVNDYQAFPGRVKEFTELVAVIGVPLLYRDQLLGVLTSHSKQSGVAFTQDQLDLLTSFANQAAIAIQNARAFAAAEQRAAELFTLQEVGQAITGRLELPAVLEAVVAGAMRLLGAQHTQIILWDEATGGLRFGAATGTEAERARNDVYPLGRGAIGTVALTREPLILEDYQASPIAVPMYPDVASTITAPVLFGDRLLGILHAHTTRAGNRFTPEDLRRLGMLATQAAIAIENARLFQQEQERRRQVEAVRGIADEITRELDLTALLDLIIRRAADLVGATLGRIFLWDEAEQVLVPRAWLGLDEWIRGLRLRLGEGIAGTVALRREGMIVNDYRTWPHANPTTLVRTGITAVLAEPLMYRDRLLGVIVLNHENGERTFSPQDRDLLALFASAAAIAIQNARLFAEVKDSYRRLQEAQDALLRAETLRALGQMAAGVAHDFNNTLAVILGQAELLRLHTRDPEIQRRLEILSTAARGGASTIRRLQEFTRRHPTAAYCPVDLRQLVCEVVELTRPRWRDEPERRGFPVTLHLDLAEVAPIRGVAGELRDALTNLVFNALDAMPHGGTLTLRAFQQAASGRQEAAGETQQAAGSGQPAAGYPLGGGQKTVPSEDFPLSSASCHLPACFSSLPAVVVEVSDTGVGMNQEVQARIFDPFFTTKGAKGSGLGLSMVYGIMERHGGEIQVESAPGRGTTVRLGFPVDGGGIIAPAAPAAVRVIPRRILLVEDEDEVRTTLVALLQSGNHQVVAVASGSEALARFEQDRFDLVITDLGMPELSGWQVASAVKARAPRVPVVLLTGWGEQSAPEAPQRTGSVDKILAKPCALDELLQAIVAVTDPKGATT
jgi:GAF domain-containing protein/ActR/RegA family two-component response regulator